MAISCSEAEAQRIEETSIAITKYTPPRVLTPPSENPSKILRYRISKSMDAYLDMTKK